MYLDLSLRNQMGPRAAGDGRAQRRQYRLELQARARRLVAQLEALGKKVTLHDAV